ncbi:MAG: glycerol kinase [Micavibrio sp.]|nr:glycerol kinase [Micavibrio sp.]
MKTDKTLLAIDQGTTSSRAILFSNAGDVLNVQQKELKLHYPHNGWVEQDARDIWHDTLGVCRKLLGTIGAEAVSNIAAVGITNQRETTILWDRKTGEPVYNAIVWQDRRTADYCKTLKDAGHEDTVRAKTGLLLDPYFSATKIAWILDHVDGVRQRAEAGDIAFGTIETYLLWKLSNGRSHISDVSNASRTMLYNIVQQKWDEELLSLFDIPRAILPEVVDNAYDFAEIDPQHFGAGLKVCGAAGDQQAALIGQACFETGMVKSTYGTGCFALMNIGEDFRASENRLLTSIAYRLNGTTNYAIEGSIFVAGAAVQFLRDNLQFFHNAAQSEALATSVADTNGVYFVPAFTGLGAPYWNPHARGAITGLTRESSQAHITRAALEAQAYQTYDLLGAMERDSGGAALETIRVDGGLVANEFVCQFLADILNVTIEVPKVIETTAWGAASLAGLQSGLYADFSDLSSRWGGARYYSPSMPAQKRTALIEGWKRAIGMLLD